MRPLRLEVEGFTSFRERLSLDFSGLDLFALTGPTGAGKSSLIDAIVFALYGQVPRVGDDYKQLISHGAERLNVLLEFEVGKERYRIARTARRAGPSQQRLERVGDGEPEPVADRVREIRARVEEILGLDYDGFTRSVVLPQGQFDAFLKGEPKERRKILVALLRLGVYDEMLKLANQKGSEARQSADFIGQTLERDFGDATPETLSSLETDLARTAAEAAEVEAALVALDAGLRLARGIRSARRDAVTLAEGHEREEKKRKAAEELLARADETRARLEADLAALAGETEALGYDDARHAALAGARPLAEQLRSLREAQERLERTGEKSARALEAARADLAQAEAAVPRAEAARAEAEARLQVARAEREAAHRRHAALALRRSLKAGEACPVCEQPVRTVPRGAEPALEAAEAGVSRAEETTRATAAAEQKARLALQETSGEVESGERELAQIEERRREQHASAAPVAAALAAAGFGEREQGDPGALVVHIAEELEILETARTTRAGLEARRSDLGRETAALELRVAAATAERDGARERLEVLAAKRSEAARLLDEALEGLRALAGRHEWPALGPLAGGRDEVDALESHRADRHKASKDLAARAATLRQQVEQTRQKIARAGELRERRETLQKDAALLRTLADHLKANELVAWIQEEALEHLAEDGSRHLAKLSQGRYALRLGSGDAVEMGRRAEQDFFVVDRWNADAVRSVRTLSGGETFLAALALALALAESLARLSAGGGAAEALESLFLDEGFGTLDLETLDVVVSALDALHGGDRMVGIVTHIRELAERLPARLEVRRAGATATATVV